jgi:hypothetical protein
LENAGSPGSVSTNAQNASFFFSLRMASIAFLPLDAGGPSASFFTHR